MMHLAGRTGPGRRRTLGRRATTEGAKMRKATIALVLGLLLVGVGCSSKKSPSSSTGGATTSAAASQSSAPATSQPAGGGGTALKAVGLSFSPTKLTVSSGGTVSFSNTASFAHTFTVDGQDVDQTVSGGQSADIKIDLPAGTYDFFCRFHGSPGSGMHGTLTVK
jgi:plastocyanin